jgi:hypothetical protein
MTHPIVDQLRFTRREFMRGVRGISEDDARKRLMPMNCIAWNIGHLAWQEQRYFLFYAQGKLLLPEVQEAFRYGAPGSTPALAEVLSAWRKITKAADPWLNSLSTVKMLETVTLPGRRPATRTIGNLLQRTIYHYWYHLGENMAIRQSLGHSDLPEFVGSIDRQAPYRPEQVPGK